MKRVEAFFQFGKLEPVVEAIEKAGVGGHYFTREDDALQKEQKFTHPAEQN
jgi:hypothetical protein